MTIEQWASMAEIVGVLGLIASLLYVGQQVRLNREQLRADASSRYYERINEIFLNSALDRDFAEVWAKGATELGSLDEVDRGRVINFEIGIIYLWAQWHPQMRRGLLPDHAKRAFEWTLTGPGQRQSVHEAWKLVRPAFDESFQQYIGGYLDQRPE